MPAPLSKELIATVLVDALFSSDEVACQKFGVSLRSLQRYRCSLPDDPELAGIVAIKKSHLDDAWVDRLFPALIEGIDTLAECVKAVRADAEAKKNPQVIAAVAGAVKICAEVQITSRMIDARIGKSDNAASGLPRSSDSQDSAYSN